MGLVDAAQEGKKPVAYGWAGGKQELVPYGLAGANLAWLGWCGFGIKHSYRDGFRVRPGFSFGLIK